MFFKNLNATLTINDKSFLNEIELSLTFKDNPEVENIVENYFAKAKKIFNSEGLRISSTQLPLSDTGKKEIVQIITSLKDLDSKFESRTKIVEEFEELLGE